MTVDTISIGDIGLSVRSENALRRINVLTVGDLLAYDEERLYQVRNLGRKSVEEILAKIEEYKVLRASDTVPADEGASLSDDAQILQWLREKQVRIDVLELLSAKAYNLLMLNGCEYLHQLAFRTKEDLLQIPRMEETVAAEIVRWVAAYIDENRETILAESPGSAVESSLTLEQMRFMPAYQKSIREYVLKNDIPLENLPISARPKNQLRKNGYLKLSDMIFLSDGQILGMKSMGQGSAEQIREMIDSYLKTHEARILAFCNGDASVLWDDTAIRKKILRLYQEIPFSGFSLEEMTERMEFPSDFPQERIKRVIGMLLAEGKLEYVDFRCYRLYERFEVYLTRCDGVDERSIGILQRRLRGITLEEIGREYDLTKERVRQIIRQKTAEVRSRYAMVTGDRWFDEDYYWYFYENYAFDRREASAWMGIPEAVWKYLDMMDVKQGKKDLESALEDAENLEIGLRLKVKNYLNRNRIFVDGIWVEKKRSELEPIVAGKFCRDEMSFDAFVKVFNGFLSDEEIPYDEDLYYTDAVVRTCRNRLADSRFILWKQNEILRYYDIDSRDYTELLETLNLDSFENVEYSTLKFMKEYPQLMKKYDIRDQYELHNLLRKIVPEGSFHDFHCGRMPEVCFGTFDRDGAILDILVEMAPVSVRDLCERISQEYGFDPGVVLGNYLQPFAAYLHDGVYSIDQKVMAPDRAEALHRLLPGDFYYIDEIRKIYEGLYPDGDPEEINPYNLKSMGFIVLSKYVVQHYPSLEAYCEELLTGEDIVDLKPYRRRLTYVQMFSQKLMELKRNLDVIEFEPGQVLNFRKLARAGITKADIRDFCNAVYDFVPDGSYFSTQSLKEDGFVSELFDLGFFDWFYANLLYCDERFSFTNIFGNIILYKGREEVTIQSFLIDRVKAHGWIDVFDLITELTEYYGCNISEKSDITYRLKNTVVFHDRILDRLYASVELYYRDLDAEGGA